VPYVSLLFALGVWLVWVFDTCLTIHVAMLLIAHHIYSQDQKDMSIISTTWIFNFFICHFFSTYLHMDCKHICLILLEQVLLENMTWTISTQHVSSIHGFKLLPLIIQQRFDPPHNMTPCSSISVSIECKYSLLHLSHGIFITNVAPRIKNYLYGSTLHIGGDGPAYT
jgi:hypothetical protein